VTIDVVGPEVAVLRLDVADALGFASAVVDVEDAAVAVVVGDAVVAVVVGDAVVAVVVAAGVVVAGGVLEDAVGEAVVVADAPLLATVKSQCRLELLPSNHVNTALMVCDPSTSCVVS
jgi:hypothetical protein